MRNDYERQSNGSGPNAGFALVSRHWDQAEISRALSGYLSALSDREYAFEILFRLVRSEIVTRLKTEFRDDIALEEAEYAAIRELKRRIDNGNVRFLTRSYMTYVCSSAARFVRKYRMKLSSMGSGEKSCFEIEDSKGGPEHSRAIKFADLYFCFEKLTRGERELIRLHHNEGKKLSEAANDLGIGHDAARKRHSIAIGKLRKCLKTLDSGGWS